MLSHTVSSGTLRWYRVAGIPERFLEEPGGLLDLLCRQRQMSEAHALLSLISVALFCHPFTAAVDVPRVLRVLRGPGNARET